MESLDAEMRELLNKARIALFHQHYENALYIIKRGLSVSSKVNPHWTRLFLQLRAECFWQIGRYDHCLKDMHSINPVGSVPMMNVMEVREEYDKWMARGEQLLDTNNPLAGAFFDLCKAYSKTPKDHARCFVFEGVAMCAFDKRKGMEIIGQGSLRDRSILEDTSYYWKTNGIQAFKMKQYQKSKQLLQRALIVTREDSQHSETRRSILSHLATVHFNLKEYQLALDAGEKSFVIKSVPSKDEAERWKERGKILFREKHFELLIKYYTLAIKFTPVGSVCVDLRSMLLSNRSIAYNKMKMFFEALADAKECVRINPNWSKGQYRLGTSLVGLERHREALASFCKAFNVAEVTETKDIALQILSVGEKIPDGITSVSLDVPKELVQELIKRVVDEKEWKKLHLLFVGGSGVPHHNYGKGGLATGCNASCVPLELVVQWGIDNSVDNLGKFVEELIKHDAPIKGFPGCSESPLQIADRRNNLELLRVLSKYDKTQGKYWKDKGIEAFNSRDYANAISHLSLAVTCHLDSKEQLHVYDVLSEVYYRTKDYRKSIESGNKLYNLQPLESKEIAEKWKKRGNDLLEKKVYDIMTDCYTLALNYTPSEDNHMRAAILSNRSMAYINQRMIEKAKKDANLCIWNRKTWFRGYSRLASCLAAENNHQEAVQQYCKGLRAVQTDEEKFNLANDIISVVTKKGSAIKIPEPIPPNIVNKLIKQAVGQKDVETLRYMFLEKTCQQQAGSTQMRTLAHDVRKISFVPIEMVLQSNVKDKQRLVLELIVHGASPDGSPHCTRKPILLALDEQDFKIAATLLQNGANPSPILSRGEIFDPLESSQGLQWLRLARKSRSMNSERTMMFYSLALEYEEVTRDASYQLEAFRNLSDICFAARKYHECLQNGYECLRLVSTKSEEKAKMWQERGEILLNRRIFSEVPGFLTLSLNYAPPSNKPLRYNLLCKRSYAYHETDDFQQALEDGSNATLLQPDDVEGYKCMVSCYKSLGRHSKTLSSLNQCLRTERSPTQQRCYFKEAIAIAVDLPEGTTALTTEVPASFIEQIQEEAIKLQEWNLLRLLYIGGGGPEQRQVGKGGLATQRVRADRVPIEDVVSTNFKSKPETLSALLDHGALVEGLRGNASPLVCAVAKDQIEVVKVLLEHGANPCLKTENNQPLLHSVVQKAIDTGRSEMLQCLLSSQHEDIENVQDSKGSTLYHLAMYGKYNSNKTHVIRLLIKANVNPTLRNKAGKQPTECCYKKKDDRNKIVSTFMRSYVPKVKENFKSQPKEVNQDEISQHSIGIKEKVENEAKMQTAAEPQPLQVSFDDVSKQEQKTAKKPQKSSKVSAAEEKKEISRKYIECLTERLKIDKPDNLSHQALGYETTEECRGIISQDNLEPVEEYDDTEEADDEYDEEKRPESAKTGEGETKILDLESPFENLSWEVDCTENVWKTLRSKRVGKETKRRIVEKIRMLAQGRWSKTLCKRLEGEPKKRGILLYESKLTKSARILWEKTVAFSPRCSNDPELRLRASEEGVSGDDSGRIYSDIIRVWSIVLDHGDLEHQIENVVKSHERGSHCIVKANLKGMKNKKSDSGNYPSYYQERKNSSTRDLPVEKKDTLYPPASSKENEYHILKFYSFTSAVIDTLLDSDGKTKIDFPFKVTELEHAIINLKPKPPCPIILLGRSGTGKTTCCLYRLWTEFQNYWESAATAGPHIPRHITIEENLEELEASAEPCTTKSSNEEENLQMSPSEDNVVVYDENDCMTNEPLIPNEEKNKDEAASLVKENEADRYEHFHPLFITKNTVLCSEVQKNFKELSNACPVTKSRTTVTDEDSLPNRIQDIGKTSWPLFIGSRDWLLLLDASLQGTSFFKRAKDGSLLKKIKGWGEEDTHLHFIPEEEEEDDDDQFEDDGGEHAATEEGSTQQSKTQAKGIKREVTYQTFRDELWPKMNKSIKVGYHPTLVWTEIRSFIKGSVEALAKDHGFLSLEEYEKLGRKRAPNFRGDRSTVYNLFENYRHICNRQGMFDEADLVYHLHSRLKENPELSWSVHSVYVDETQDFTQAELSLLIRCCRFQNRMFFTGDTAQSIMRGIAFRFEDLKTLFHGIKEFNDIIPNEPVRIPDRLYQLTHNYRSHAGILSLASSVVDLLLYYFPESFDKLEKDQGLFDGPKPVLLESCSLSDLAMILRGNKRQASRIEFGAHQAVLVVSEEARDNMPDELKHGLVLTIYEAKGLEFDDVLIYNFFKDSHAKKEWRVVTSYIENHKKQHLSGAAGLVEIEEKDLTLKSRPLEFQPDKHKVLNSEFKFLYTAITRARVNVWFFDEDEESRGPMFEYFRQLNLVRAITLKDEGERTTTSLTSMFAESSTKDEWRDQGMFFYNKGLWAVAEKCFIFAEDELMIRKSKAQQQAQEALKHRSNPRVMKEKFRNAAARFLECNMAEEAAVCLYNARERLLLAKLYRRMEKYVEASKYFRIEAHYEEASECMENTNNYSQAIEIFCEAKLFRKAIEVLERYNSLKIDEMLFVDGFVPPKPNRTIERLCYKLAETHLRENKRKEMEAVLQRLPSVDDRISFFMKNRCIEEAARALVENNRREEAAQFLQLHGRFREAMKYSNDSKFLADCSLYEARALVQNPNAGETGEEMVQLLEDAIKHFRRCKDQNGEGEALLLLGRRKDDPNLIKESGKIFHQSHNICGECEVVQEWLQHGNPEQFYYRIIARTMEGLLDLIINLHKPYTQLKAMQQTQIIVCEQYFGLSRVDNPRFRSYRTNFCEKFNSIASKELQDEGSKMQVEMEVKDAYEAIVRHLITKAIDMCHKATTFFRSKCESKATADSHYVGDIPFNERFEALFNWVFLDSSVIKFYNHLKQLRNSPIVSAAENLLPQEKERFLPCKLFVEFLLPGGGCKVQHVTSEQITKIRKHHAVKPRLMQYCDNQWKSSETETKATITDVFLQVSQVMHLLDLKEGIVRYLSAKEDSFLQMFRKNQNKKLIRVKGMLTLKEGRQESFEIFLRYWENGTKNLYVNGDIIQSLHETSRRFLTYTAKSYSDFYPSIANTLMILEHQLTVSLLMFARLKCQSSFFCCCIPESYLSRLRFTDELNCSRRGLFTTFRAVEKHARSLQDERKSCFQEEQKCLRKVQSLLSYIVKLMFGIISYDFNVFYDTFFVAETTENLIASEIADRTLVLSLTMLVNCGKVLYANCEEIILQYIFSVNPHASLPDHLKIAFQKMSEVRDISDTVKVLKNLLHARNDEKLLDMRWNYAAFRPDTKISNPENYDLMFDVNLLELRAKAKAESESRPVVSDISVKDQVEEQEDDNTVEADLAFRINEREKERKDQENLVKTAITLQRIFRQGRKRKEERKKKDLPEGREDLHSTEDHLSVFKTDSSACTICGVDFQDKLDKQEEGLEVPTKYENHIASSSHKLRQQHFDEYKSLYVSRIEKVLSRVRHLDERGVTGIELDLQQLERIRTKVWKKVREIETGRHWQDTKALIPLLESLEKKVQEIEKMADQVQASTTTEFPEKDEVTKEGDIDDDEDGDLEVLPAAAGKQRKTQGQRSKERKRRRKGR